MSKYTTEYLAQFASGTLFAGVDLGLDSLVVVVLNGAGQRLDRFRAANRLDGYGYLRDRLQRTVQKQAAPGVLVGMEPTDYYWKQVGYDLEQHQVPFRLVNPLTVKRHREGDHLDRSKDDWRDAFTIADLLRTGKFTQTNLPHGCYAELQTGYAAYRRLRRDHGRQMNLLINTVRQLFPEFEQVFPDWRSHSAQAVIAAGVAPQRITQLGEEDFVAGVRARFNGQRLAQRQVRKLYALAATAHGFSEAAAVLERLAQQQVETMRLLDRQAASLLEPLLRLFHSLPEAPYLLSIQGVQAPAALGLVAFIGDLRHYDSGRALIKLAGTQPTPHTSGRKTHSLTPFSHQGRSGLRSVLYFLTLHLLTNNAAIRAHYQRLQTRPIHPLPKMQALGACMNKVLWYVWHVVHAQEFYQADRWQMGRSAQA